MEENNLPAIVEKDNGDAFMKEIIKGALQGQDISQIRDIYNKIKNGVKKGRLYMLFIDEENKYMFIDTDYERANIDTCDEGEKVQDLSEWVKTIDSALA